MSKKAVVATPPKARPKRSFFFAEEFCQQMVAAQLATEIGPAACWLLAVVAMKEADGGYTGPLRQFDSQIQYECGFRSVEALDISRKSAVAAGWLPYEAGRIGGPGEYWVLMPDEPADK